jgi:hypothetical protein
VRLVQKSVSLTMAGAAQAVTSRPKALVSTQLAPRIGLKETRAPEHSNFVLGDPVPPPEGCMLNET